MRKVISLFLGIVFCFLFVGCTQKEKAYVMLNNTFVEAEGIKEVGKIAGFDINISEQLFDDSYEMESRAIPNKLIEIVYKGLDKWVIIRKSIYEGDDDVSGDYNEYPEIKEKNYKNGKVVYKGMEDKINLVTWKDGKYAYSINMNPGGIGFSYEEVKKIFSNIN